jgi:hypothetical protein
MAVEGKIYKVAKQDIKRIYTNKNDKKIYLPTYLNESAKTSPASD